jgi:hypothetical protein
LAYVRAKCVQKNAAWHVQADAKIYVFPWYGVVEANGTVMKRFLRLFSKPSQIRCSDFAKKLSFKILMEHLRYAFSRLRGL